MKFDDIESLQKEFEGFDFTQNSCSEEECNSDSVDLKDYPSYTDALYALLMAPVSCGVYISKIDIKRIAYDAGESMAIHPRKRMFELLMKYAIDKETMQRVLESMGNHIEEKIAIYEELYTLYPQSKEIFHPQVEKAQQTIRTFPKVIREYFA